MFRVCLSLLVVLRIFYDSVFPNLVTYFYRVFSVAGREKHKLLYYVVFFLNLRNLL